MKTVLITGASSGIGKALAGEFAMHDYHIVGVSENEAGLARAAYDALMHGDRMVVPGMANNVLVFSRRIMSKEMQAKINKERYEVREE